MDKHKLKNIDMVARFSNFQVINKDFTRCRCNIFYTGRNRNYSDITEDALQKFISRKGYANVPVVAHLIKGDDGNYRVGGHDSKIVLSNEGIEFVDECIPYGVIPEDCNPSMDLITERSGEQRKYFSVDIILWTHRYPIMEASYGDEIYFNQSMEITYNDYSWDKEYVVIHDFSLSALCLLNKSTSLKDNVEPCFESSAVKKFSINESNFKHNFQIMLEQLKQYKLVGTTTIQNKKTNNSKKGEHQMELKKFVEALSPIKITDTENSKYALLSITDTKVNVLDMEDYKAYAFDYAITSENDVDELVINFDSKVEMSLSACEKITEEGFEEFSISNVINTISTQKTNEAVDNYTRTAKEEFNSKITELSVEYENLNKSYTEAMKLLDTYQAADAAREKKEHDEAIDEVVSEFSKRLSRVPEFLIYKARLDYSKSIEEIKKDLTLMAGKSVMDTQTKSSFSYNPVSTTYSKNNKSQSTTNRYGHLLDKFAK